MNHSQTKTHVFEIHVPLYEVDMGGGVYHGNYFHFFELAREALLEETGFPYRELVACGHHMTVAEIHCTYRKPLFYNQKITILTRITKIGSRSVTFTQEIWDKDCEKLLTELSIHLVCIDQSGRARQLPKRFKKALVDWTEKTQP